MVEEMPLEEMLVAFKYQGRLLETIEFDKAYTLFELTPTIASFCPETISEAEVIWV